MLHIKIAAKSVKTTTFRCSSGLWILMRPLFSVFKNNIQYSISRWIMVWVSSLEIVAVDLNEATNHIASLLMVYCSLPSAISVVDCSRLWLMGDLNIPDFNWELFVHPDSTYITLFLTSCLTQLVDQPTWWNNIFDSVFCSDIICRDNMSFIASFYGDHLFIYFIYLNVKHTYIHTISWSVCGLVVVFFAFLLFFSRVFLSVCTSFHFFSEIVNYL